MCLEGSRLKGLNMRMHPPPPNHQHPPPAFSASWLILLLPYPLCSLCQPPSLLPSSLFSPLSSVLFLSVSLSQISSSFLFFVTRKEKSPAASDSLETMHAVFIASYCRNINNKAETYASLSYKWQKVTRSVCITIPFWSTLRWHHTWQLE